MKHSALLNTPVVAFEDCVNRVYRIMPTPAFGGVVDAAVAHIMPMIAFGKEENGVSAAKTTTKASLQGTTGKIPRPPNAFILYRQHHHPFVKATYPEYHNNDICKSQLILRSVHH